MRTLLLSILVFVSLAICLPAQEGHSNYEALWNSPQVQNRIEAGIKANRMGYSSLHFVDANDKPLDNVKVAFRQTSHDFLFGSDIFALNGFSTEKDNRRYEDAFVSTFNFATVPFYWRDLEPTPGQLRYEKNSTPIARRPPPDAVVEFCIKHHIAMRGHNLIGPSALYVAKWLPNDQDEVTKLAAKRFASIAARYGEQIGIWDVINEALGYSPSSPLLPKDFAYWGMREADHDFPSTAKLGVNEGTEVWTDFHKEDSPYYLYLQNLLLRGARVDIIGMQFHLFSQQVYDDVLAGKTLKPQDMYRVLDQYGKLGRAINVTEITIPTTSCSTEGEADQAKVVRNFYRLWFSHPAIQAITWWNLADGTAIASENHLCGGLLRKDLSPKASFAVLQSLIQREWHTEGSNESGAKSVVDFQGFFGNYDITATRAGQTIHQTVHLSKAGNNDFTVRFP